MAIIEIDGKQLEVENGKTIIEVADEHGIPIPRFCYHKKLSVAANCRMCLVEVEKSRKPLPACATTITDGMRVFTKSPMAVEAQKAVMEFLLINHPLDCPICDQGGECELQDVSLVFGQDFSDYVETKRAVKDDNLGALVATEMTRCIHCTRCVRFGEEVAGLRELGATGRGENMQIGTYVEHSLQSEVSGNIIDLCPVGALTSKPFRFRARAWELQQYPSIAPHDAIGSAVELHVRRGEVMRVVPKDNEALNETWLSDRDRFSYLGLQSPDRLLKPMIKVDGQWQETDWTSALKKTVEKLQSVIKKHGADQAAGLASPSATLEELYLFQKLMRALDIHHLDHRLHQVDFSDDSSLDWAPIMKVPYAAIEQQKAILILGSHLNHEQPLANLRVRKAFLQGAKVMAINPADYPLPYEICEKIIAAPQYLPYHLAEVVKALEGLSDQPLPKEAHNALSKVKPGEKASAIARYLRDEESSTLILGAIAHNHPEASWIRALVRWLELLNNGRTQVVFMTEGANASGAFLSGVLPHRGPMGQPAKQTGMDVQSALRAHLKAYFCLNVDPGLDIANPHLAEEAMNNAECVIMMTPFVNETIKSYADVLLPMALYAETSGTYVNVAGTWQTFRGAVLPQGEARPAWKILRVLGNLFHVEGFDYNASEEVLDELKRLEAVYPEKMDFCPEKIALPEKLHDNELYRIGEWPLYRTDSLCRHAEALQHSVPGKTSTMVRLHPETASKLDLGSGKVLITQGDFDVVLPFEADDSIPKDAVYVPCALEETRGLGHSFAPVIVRKV